MRPQSDRRTSRILDSSNCGTRGGCRVSPPERLRGSASELTDGPLYRREAAVREGIGGLGRQRALDQLNPELMSATLMRDQLDAAAEPGYQRRDGTRLRRSRQ